MGTIRVNGSTSGYVELAAPAVAGSVVMTLPATTGTLAVQGEAYGRSSTATVATSQTTTSLSYTDLATAGPAVTVTTGTKALVIITTKLWQGTANPGAFMSFAVSGATTVSASDIYGVSTEPQAASTYAGVIRASASTLLTGLTAGSNTFTGKYKTSNASYAAYFQYRDILVIDMGS